MHKHFLKSCRRTKKIAVLVLGIAAPIFFTGCFKNRELKQSRSAELQQLVFEDQLYRKKTSINTQLDGKYWKKEIEKNLMHRQKVEQIFKQNDTFTAKDYLAASLIYQHGNKPRHYYQAYIWAQKAIKMGEKSGGSLMASTIDRYLISIGKKQIFGTQILIKKAKDLSPCFCIYDTELSFPDSLRKKYTGNTLKEIISNNMTFFGVKKYCPNHCGPILKPTHKNIVPELW